MIDGTSLKQSIIINIGNELLSAKVRDKNAFFLARELKKLNFNIHKMLSISDLFKDIQSEITSLLTLNVQYIFISGGLGPTEDDRTRFALAKALNIKLILYDKYWNQYLSMRKKKALHIIEQNIEQNKKQFFFPKDSTIFSNPYGTAHAFSFYYPNNESTSSTTDKGIQFFLFPGVFYELKSIYYQYIASFCLEKLKLTHLNPQKETWVLKICDISESFVDSKMNQYFKTSSITWTILLTSYDTVLLTIDFLNPIDVKMKNIWKRRIWNYFSKNIYAINNQSILKNIYRLAIRKNIQIAFVESCTAGLLSALFARKSKISKIYKGAIVLYQKSMKLKLTNIEPQLIQKSTLNVKTVDYLANWGLNFFQSDICLSITGLLGPLKESEGDPDIGSIFLSIQIQSKQFFLAKKKGEDLYWTNQFKGPRTMIQRKASFFALYCLFKTLKSIKPKI